MGTHPIFESDFDCLTESYGIRTKSYQMNRTVLSRPCLYLRQNSLRSYRQDMPPPGGYAAIPWRRSIPTRGFGYIGVLISGYLIYDVSYLSHQRYTHWRKQSMLETANLDTACMPLWEAEMDRDELRSLKHQIESEAVNIVASGFDKNWKCGGYGIGDNGNPDYWPSNGYKSPYNLQIWKNWNGNRFAKQYTPAHQAMSINNAMYGGAGKFEKVGPNGNE